MAKNDWTNKALLSLQFFKENPEYKSEFGHQYFINSLGISRATLNRNEVYLTKYQQVKEFLKGFKSTNPLNGPAKTNTEKSKLESQSEKISQLERDKTDLQLRINECYQLLEDHGIDPQFVYPKKLKKDQQA